jgi:hypothetical protein
MSGKADHGSGLDATARRGGARADGRDLSTGITPHIRPRRFPHFARWLRLGLPGTERDWAGLTESFA